MFLSFDKYGKCPKSRKIKNWISALSLRIYTLNDLFKKLGYSGDLKFHLVFRPSISAWLLNVLILSHELKFELKVWFSDVLPIIYGLKIAVPFIFISDSNNQTQIKILKEIQVINLFYRYSCASCKSQKNVKQED